MREHEKAEAYSGAIELLVTEAVAAAKPKSPGAYAATVRADLSQRHRSTARDLFREHGELHAEHLALLLSASERGSDPTPAATSAPVLEPWTPPEPDGTALPRTAVRERIAQVKEQLRTVSKPPIPERSA